MRRLGSLVLVTLFLAACDAIVKDSFTFPGAQDQAGGGQGGEGGAPGERCVPGEDAFIRIANLLENQGGLHLCVRYSEEVPQYISQNSVHGFPQGLPPATVSRYRGTTSGEFSFGFDDATAPTPCLEPKHVQKLCIQPGTHATIIAAGNLTEPGQSPPVLQIVQDLEPSAQVKGRVYTRVIHSVAPGPSSSPWLDVIVWNSAAAGELLIPFRDLKFGAHPTTRPKEDPLLPINGLGYIDSYFGLPLVEELEIILPLTLELGGLFSVPAALAQLAEKNQPTPLTVFLWGDLRPGPGDEFTARFPGLKMLACLDEATPGLDATPCTPLPRAIPGEKKLPPFPRVRLGNLTPEPTRYCILPYSASSDIASRGNRPGWSEMPPEGIVVEPFSILRDRLWPRNDYLAVNLPLSKTCEHADVILQDAKLTVVDGCVSIRHACNDFSVAELSADQSTPTMVFDGSMRRDYLYQAPPQPGLVTARLINLTTDVGLLSGNLSGSTGYLWTDIAPRAGDYDVPGDDAPAVASFAPQPQAYLRWHDGKQGAVSAAPVVFASRTGRSFTLWAGGSIARLGDPADPQAPFVLACDNEPPGGPALDCERIAMVPEP